MKTEDSSRVEQNVNKVDALLVLRGIACLMVVIIHCDPPRNSIIYRGYDISWLTFSNGIVAVWIFFCLSGYLMGKAFYTGRYTSDISGIKNFWRNRALRIFPLYYFSVLILSIFVYPDVLRIKNWETLVRILTFTYDSTTIGIRGDFNPVFWSLSTEVQFYILIPFIYIVISPRIINVKHVIGTMLGIIITLTLLRFLIWSTFHDQICQYIRYYVKYLYAPLALNIDIFLCGFLVNICLQHKKNTASISEYKDSYFAKFLFRLCDFMISLNKPIAIIMIGLFYLFTSYHLYHKELFNTPDFSLKTNVTIFILPIVTALITSFFIFTFESDVLDLKNEKLSFKACLSNPLRIPEIFGVLSYGVYLWHYPIAHKISSIFSDFTPIESFYWKLITTLFLSTLLAGTTYYLIELPSQKLKKIKVNTVQTNINSVVTKKT